MMKYRLAIALLWCIGSTSLLCLLMNLNWFFALLLLPGGLVAFAVGFLLFRKSELPKLKQIVGWSMLPVATVTVLACVPSMNPLFPRGMAELEQQESELQNAIQVGMRVEHVRDVLNSKNIQFYEFSETTGGSVLENPETAITTQSGDVVLASRFHTDAFKFPCGYDMQIIVLFGRDGRLKQRYIRRLMMCP